MQLQEEERETRKQYRCKILRGVLNKPNLIFRYSLVYNYNKISSGNRWECSSLQDHISDPCSTIHPSVMVPAVGFSVGDFVAAVRMYQALGNLPVLMHG